ncbi:MAG: Rne/Rng family ribonuclease [Variibacter sp.]
MANKMLIDATHPEETRVVVVRGNRVEEFDFESESRRQLRGNIYLAKVTRVEPSLQAAFVEYGGNRHGFLAFSEIHPDYYQIPVADRQALIEDEERAHRDAEADADRRAHHRSGSRRRNAHARGNNVRRSAPVEDAEPQASRVDESGAHLENADEPHDIAASTHDDAGAMHEAAPHEHHDGAAPAGEDVPETQAGAAAPIADAEFGAQAPEAETVADADSSEPAPTDNSADHQPHAEDAHSEPAGEPAGEPTHVEHAHGEPATHGDDAHDHDHGDAPNGNGNVDEVGGDDDEEDAVESVGGADAFEEVQERAPRFRRQYKIQEVIKRRQVMLVQVVKEERGTKGAALTTYLSLAGRYSVLMPNTARGGGISRKITSAEDRKRLKQIAQDLEVPEGMGVILRTAGANRTKAEVKRDFEYLLRMWETVRDLTLKSSAPTLVYEEGSLVKRSIRDLYNKDIDEVVVAGDAAYREAKDFMRMLMPSHAKNVKPYKDTQPLFTRSGIESQLDAMFSPVVQLRSGGYIVINQTEALVAIDVNSGRATREHHIEDTALKTNLEAAEEISRQLRLRDLAGLIVIDFIDMDENRNNRSVERKLKECLKHDRARIQVGRISHFGLLEMSRQRIRSSVLESSTEKCPHCGGSGHVRSVSSLTLQLLRSIEEMLLKGATHNLVARTSPEVALYVLNHKRAHLHDLEERFQITIAVNADDAINGQQPFVVERGEQVHSVEAARAIAMRPGNVAAVVPEDDEDDFDETEDTEEMEAVLSEGVARAEAESEGEAEGEAEGESGGRRRRRRRRRRRGGGGDAAETAEAAAPSEFSATEDQEEDGGEPPPDNMQGEPAAAANGDGDGDGERRRRRRGRRGGRRNRREHEGGGEAREDRLTADPQLESGWQQWAENRPADAIEPPSANAEPAPATGFEPAVEQPAEIRREPPAPQPAPPPPAPAAVAIESEPAAEQVPVRRRSTVREPAPTFGSFSTTPSTPPDPVPEVAPEAPKVESEEPAADKPRRAGWWSRKILGKS